MAVIEFRLLLVLECHALILSLGPKNKIDNYIYIYIYTRIYCPELGVKYDPTGPCQPNPNIPHTGHVLLDEHSSNNTTIVSGFSAWPETLTSSTVFVASTTFTVKKQLKVVSFKTCTELCCTAFSLSVLSLAFCLAYLPNVVWLILNDASLAFNIIELGTFILLVFRDLFILGVFTGPYQNKIDRCAL